LYSLTNSNQIQHANRPGNGMVY